MLCVCVCVFFLLVFLFFFLFISGCQLLPVALAVPVYSNLQLLCWALRNQVTKIVRLLEANFKKKGF